MKRHWYWLLCSWPVWAGAQTVTLEPVVVTATRYALAQVDAPASISVITAQQIAERGADNLFEALRTETGISLIGRTISGRRNISLRGMDGRHTLFLIDGKRISASDGVIGHSDFQYDWVAVQDIERIEVVRGPMSVLYGAEALGGVVNIITRSPGERWALRTTTEGSGADGGLGGDGHRLAVSVDGPLSPHWRVGITAAQSRRQAIETRSDARISDLEGHDKLNGALRLVWLASAAHQVELEHRQGQEERWAGAHERSGAKRFYQSVTDLSRSHSSLGWTADWGGIYQANSLLRAYSSRLEVLNSRSAGVAALRPNTLKDEVLEGQASLSPTAKVKVSTGFEWREETLHNEGLPGGQGQAQHRAVFGQTEIALLPQLAWTVGLRHDHHDRFGSEWSPRSYWVWRLDDQWVVKGGVGRGFKAPTLKQISPGYREDEGPNTYFGNAALVPETNQAVELGAGWSTKTQGLQVMLFHNRVQHLIVPRLLGSSAGRGQYVFENIDRARLQGVEVLARTALPAGFKLSANYTYLDAEDGQGQRLEKRPRHAVGMQLDWQRGPWRAGLRSDTQADQVLASNTPGQAAQPIPSLTRVSAHVAWAMNKNLEWIAGVDNLTNLQLADKSPLLTWAESPRTWRLQLRGQW